MILWEMGRRGRRAFAQPAGAISDLTSNRVPAAREWVRRKGGAKCNGSLTKASLHASAETTQPHVWHLRSKRYAREQTSVVPYAGRRVKAVICGGQQKRRERWLASPRDVYIRVPRRCDQPEACCLPTRVCVTGGP